MRWVLYNGSGYWVAPGVVSADVDEAVGLTLDDVRAWVRNVRTLDDGGFYPVGCEVAAELHPEDGSWEYGRWWMEV